MQSDHHPGMGEAKHTHAQAGRAAQSAPLSKCRTNCSWSSRLPSTLKRPSVSSPTLYKVCTHAVTI
eukprot:8637222-Pyramimonas_sp.AAC.1